MIPTGTRYARPVLPRLGSAGLFHCDGPGIPGDWGRDGAAVCVEPGSGPREWSRETIDRFVRVLAVTRELRDRERAYSESAPLERQRSTSSRSSRASAAELA